MSFFLFAREPEVRASIRIVRGAPERRCSSCLSNGRGSFVCVEGLGAHILFCRSCADRIGVAAARLNPNAGERSS